MPYLTRSTIGLIILLSACTTASPPETESSAHRDSTTAQVSPSPAASRTPEPTAVPSATPIPTPTPEPGYVSHAMLGDAWPLTVEDGVLSCTTASGGEAVFFGSGGVIYTVNGWAQTYYPDLPEIDPIWAAGQYAPKMDISPLIELGLDLCN